MPRSNVLTNNGAITVAGTVKITQDVVGTGSFAFVPPIPAPLGSGGGFLSLANYSRLELDGAVGGGQTIKMANGGDNFGILVIGDLPDFHATIAGFTRQVPNGDANAVTGDTIELKGNITGLNYLNTGWGHPSQLQLFHGRHLEGTLNFDQYIPQHVFPDQTFTLTHVGNDTILHTGYWSNPITAATPTTTV